MHAVVTGQDCTGLKIGRRLYDMPILADGEVRYVGQPIAVVVAKDKYAARDAAMPPTYRPIAQST